MEILEEEEDEGKEEEKEFELFTIGNKQVKCYSDGPNKGWLIENYLNSDEQQYFYKYTVQITKGTDEWNKIATTAPLNPCPLAFDNLVYTGTSNCQTPTDWYKLAEKIWTDLQTLPNFKEQSKKFNSFYSQLYGPKSIMKRHKDEYVNWGVSISIGASSKFSFGKHTVSLHSGSVFVADFSQVEHEVLEVCDNTAPGWFDLEESMNRSRLSVQIRAIEKPARSLSADEFRGMINK
jgi:hypothetical protein